MRFVPVPVSRRQKIPSDAQRLGVGVIGSPALDMSEKDCVVITGSHNLGFKASYANDENLAVIRGNRALACAYAVHVLDVYEHYRFRAVQEEIRREAELAGKSVKKAVDRGFLREDDTWQDKYVAPGQVDLRTYLLADQ